jgi:hypothetical protein
MTPKQKSPNWHIAQSAMFVLLAILFFSAGECVALVIFALRSEGPWSAFRFIVTRPGPVGEDGSLAKAHARQGLDLSRTLSTKSLHRLADAVRGGAFGIMEP